MKPFEIYKVWCLSTTNITIEKYCADNNICENSEIKEATTYGIKVLMAGGKIKDKRSGQFDSFEDYIGDIKGIRKEIMNADRALFCTYGKSDKESDISYGARQIYVNRKPKNKKEELYFEMIETLIDNIERYYNKDLFKSSGMINYSMRNYDNKREGILVKFAPYQSIVIVNVFGLIGNQTFDVATKKLYGGSQVGLMFRFSSAPSKDELIDCILSYDILTQFPLKNACEINDLGRFNIYPTASEFFKNNQDYVVGDVPINLLLKKTLEEINEIEIVEDID